MCTILLGSHYGLDGHHHHQHNQQEQQHPAPSADVSPHPPQQQLEPHNHVPSTTTNPTEDLGHVQVLVSEQKFLVKLDTRGYTSDELQIKTEDGFLIIRGETEENGGEEVKTSRKFCRRFLLPPNCKENESQCELGGLDGNILKVTIPRQVTPEVIGKFHHISGPDEGPHWSPSPSHVSPPSPTSYPCQDGHGHLAVNGHPLAGIESTRDQFVLRLDLPKFCPEEILVKTVDDYLVVEGNQGEKEDGSGNGGVFASCSFRRRYLLPLNADRDGIRCEFEEGGRLTVTVPRKLGFSHNLHYDPVVVEKTDHILELGVACDYHTA